jgi:DMSO reductase family type II enzyme heme b subunit
MLASFVRGAPVEWLLDASADPWDAAAPEALALVGVPLALQPTAAVRSAWSKRRVGAVDRVEVSALHNGEVLAFRLEWRDASENRDVEDNDRFPDAAAVLLPAGPGAPLVSMGAPGAPVNAWYWRADSDTQGRQVLAEGIGTSRTPDLSRVRTHGVWKGGRWSVVIARALRVEGSEPYAQLAPGATTQFAVAVWEGSNGERGGIKSFSGQWQPLRLAPVAPSGRS